MIRGSQGSPSDTPSPDESVLDEANAYLVDRCDVLSVPFVPSIHALLDDEEEVICLSGPFSFPSGIAMAGIGFRGIRSYERQSALWHLWATH